MKTLTVSKALPPNFTRWQVDDFEIFEKKGYGVVTVQILSPPATGYYVEKKVYIRDAGAMTGLTDKIEYVATVGGELKEQLVVTENAINLATAFTDAFTAYRSGANMAARRAALEAWMLTAGVAGSSLAGT